MANVEDSLQGSFLSDKPPIYASPFQRRLTIRSKPYYIIHDLESTREDRKYTLECQLEYAFQRRFSAIVLECVDLGVEAIRWIRMGNFLHKSGVLFGLGALTTAAFLPSPYHIYFSCASGVCSLISVGLYNLSWNGDPCCKYQVDYQAMVLSKIPSKEFTKKNKMVVLVRRNDIYRRRLHNSVALLVLGVLGFQFYRLFSEQIPLLNHFNVPKVF